MSNVSAFEILESPDEGARFCIAHSDVNTSVGMIILKSDGELPKHHWPQAAQLLQVSGQCGLTLVDTDEAILEQHELAPGNSFQLNAGAWNILTNSSDEEAVILFKISGDATEMIEKIRKTYAAINLEIAE
jgi:quercetin dioxygenase-like cupin family protein